MCEPVSIGTAMALATGAQAYGQIRQGQVANAVGIREQNVANQNADMLAKAAKDAKEQGEVAVDERRFDASREQGAGRASFAGGNVDLSSGSAAYWEADQKAVTEGDVGTIRTNAAREAFNLRMQGRNEIIRGQMARYTGKQALYASYLGAAGTTLGGGARTALAVKGM